MTGSFSLATWNVNSIKVRAPHVLNWLAETRTDLLGLQELKLPTELFPSDAFAEAGYQAAVHGQKTYNGVALLSRREPEAVTTGVPELADDPQARVVTARFDDVTVINVYVPNGESVDSDKYQYKMRWLEALTEHLRGRHDPEAPLALVGDFNIAPDERDIYDPVLFKGQVLFSEPERAALQKLLSWGLVDLFRRFHDEGGLYSWWDYRMNAFRRKMGARLDLILVTEPLARRAISCEIDVAPRRLEKPSDHTPVVARFE